MLFAMKKHVTYGLGGEIEDLVLKSSITTSIRHFILVCLNVVD